MPDRSAIDAAGFGMFFATEGGAFPAFSSVSLRVAAGWYVVLIGPPGCGKSTLLRNVADLLQSTNGHIRVFGDHPSEVRRQRCISFVFQDATLLAWRTGVKNVALPLQVGGQARLNRPCRDPRELLELIGLKSRENSYPAQFSGGQCQRFAIARALVMEPEILLREEPFGALDEITRDNLNDELLRIWRKTGTTVLFVTHGLAEAAFLSRPSWSWVRTRSRGRADRSRRLSARQHHRSRLDRPFSRSPRVSVRLLESAHSRESRSCEPTCRRGDAGGNGSRQASQGLAHDVFKAENLPRAKQSNPGAAEQGWGRFVARVLRNDGADVVDRT